MKKDNVVQQKSYAFALKIVQLYRRLLDEEKSMYYQNRFFVPAHPLEQTWKKALVDSQKRISSPKCPSHTKNVAKPIIGCDSFKTAATLTIQHLIRWQRTAAKECER